MNIENFKRIAPSAKAFGFTKEELEEFRKLTVTFYNASIYQNARRKEKKER